MTSEIIGNKQIVKNTILLYIRQILTIVISLYTSRVVLSTLGVDDFGIYNVVGGIVLMFSFITSTMASASQRYLSFDIAKGDDNRLNQTFSLIMLSYVIISFFAFLACESIAVWFLNAKMNIPLERMSAANWVLQFSILSFVATLLATPYMSAVIAREKMDVYAYASVCDVLLKLVIVYALSLSDFDKLKVYAVLMFVANAIITLFYALYCISKFNETRYRFYYNRSELKEMFAFAWWNVLGSLSNVLRSQGINILLNIFFNPAINAARGIAYNVNSAISNFTNNFYTAVRPQIIKRYATGALTDMYNLVFVSSKFAYYLLLILSLPILFETETILNIWLKNPPEYSALFVKLIIVNSLLEVLNYPLVNAIQATGKIKTYQLVVSGCYLLNLPISYVLLKRGLPPESTMYVNIILLFVCFGPRLFICKKVVGLSIREYMSKVVARVILVSTISFLIAFIIKKLYFGNGLLIDFALNVLFIVVSTLIISYQIGLTKDERSSVKRLIKSKIKK